MSTDKEKEDKILEELNRRIDEEKAEEEKAGIEEEVEKRLKEERKKEVKPAYFKGKDDKKKKIAPKKTPLYECPSCGSTNSRNLGEEETIYKIRGVLFSNVLYCNDCGKRFGVVKE